MSASHFAEDRGLQGLRGFSAMAVVLYHIYLLSIPTLAARLLFGWGWTGVILFFVISGYILGKKWWNGDYTSLPNESRSAGMWRYFSRRFWRIWPLYLGTLPLYWLFLGLPLIWPTLIMAQYSPLAAGVYVPLLPQWTLAIEEIFYLSLPLWTLAAESRWRWAVLMILAAVSLGTTLDHHFQFQLPEYAVAYMFGLLAARGYEVRLSRAGLAGVAVTAALYFNFWYYFVVRPALVGAIVYWIVLTNLKRSRLTTNRLAFGLGSLSYPIYLIGLPILYVLQFKLGLSDYLLTGSLAIGLTIMGAWILHRGFEKPLIGFGRWLESLRWSATRQPSQPRTVVVPAINSARKVFEPRGKAD